MKDTFKNRSQQIAQFIPCCFQHIGKTLKVESQSIYPVSDALCQSGKGVFDLLPDGDDVALEFVIGFPEMHKGSHQSGNSCDNGKQRT